MSNVLEVVHLGKSFKEYRSEWQRIFSWFGFNSKPIEEYSVLEDISFSVGAGEAIGVVGKNGAGKSTLLKIITGTLKPSTGNVLVKGRISAILELGMGFHPDLTGRQNAYHSAGLMGFSFEEIDSVIEQIEAFADIGEYFNHPVRSYSSGMQVRVAFAVATAFRPSILIVDEALSVGDAEFQRKCFRRIDTFQKEGTTLLFVSHDLETIKKICTKALYIKDKKLQSFDLAKKICDMYEKDISENTAKEGEEPTRTNTAHPDTGLSYGDTRATIKKVWLTDTMGTESAVFESGTPFIVNYTVQIHDEIDNVGFAMMFKTREGIAMYGTDSEYLKTDLFHYEKNHTLTVSFSLSNHLSPGTYYMNCGVFQQDPEKGRIFLHRLIDVLIFKIVSSERTTVGSGLIDLNAKLTVKKAINAD